MSADPESGQRACQEEQRRSGLLGHLLTRRYFLRGAGSALVGTSVLAGLADTALADSAAPTRDVAGQVFPDADAVYATLGSFVGVLCQSEGLGAELRRLNKTVLLELSDPDSRIYIELLDDEARVAFGSSQLKPKTTLFMSANTAHALFVGSINWATATSEQQLLLKGAFDDLAALAPRLHVATPVIYRGMLVEGGKNELVPG